MNTSFVRRSCLALALASLSALAACGAPAEPVTPKPTETAPAAAAGDIKAPGEAKVGDRTSCPISKEVFTVKEDSPKAEYGGKTYYFCCNGCDKEFAKSPAKFVGNAPKESK